MEECEKTRDLLRAMQIIESKWNEKSNLRPKFILVGSIIEGTRVGYANELDLTVTFEGLKYDPFELGEDAFTLKIFTESHPLKKFCSESGTLDFSLFLRAVLEEIEFCVQNEAEKISQETNNHLKIAQRSNDFSGLSPEYDPKLGSYFKLPEQDLCLLTHTKIGACLIFLWNQSEVLTVDLIPVLPVAGSSIQALFESVTQSLLSIPHPPNWLSYLISSIKKDMILPQSYKSLFEMAPKEPFNVAMKILHYGKGPNNFIIKPMQILGVTKEFKSNPEIKDIYCFIKCIKSCLDVNINSYFLKKVILSDEVKKDLILYDSNIDKKEALARNIHFTLNMDDLRPYFENVIGYYKYKEPLNEIPLDKGEQNLIKLARRGNLSEVKTLIENGCDVNERENNQLGFTALMQACHKGIFSVVKYLVEEGGADVNKKDLYGYSCLTRAVIKNHLSIVIYLFEKGADINSTDINGATPFFQAVENNHSEIMHYLFNNGADINQTLKVAAENNENESPLYVASEMGHIDAVKFLLAKGANVEIASLYGTPLMIACKEGFFDIVRILIEDGKADIFKTCQDKTALDFAQENNHHEIVNFLKDVSSKQEP